MNTKGACIHGLTVRTVLLVVLSKINVTPWRLVLETAGPQSSCMIRIYFTEHEGLHESRGKYQASSVVHAAFPNGCDKNYRKRHTYEGTVVAGSPAQVTVLDGELSQG